MKETKTQYNKFSVLVSELGWAWPRAVSELFKPAGVSMLIARNMAEFVNILDNQRIHATIVDTGSDKDDGLSTVRRIRMSYPLQPCIILKEKQQDNILNDALNLRAFGVVDKPVDMEILRVLLNRLFQKNYNSDVFSRLRCN